MDCPASIRSLGKGWLLSFLAWGLVGLVMAANGVATRGDAWSSHIAPSLHAWLPWALFTPLLFRLVTRFPLDRQHWSVAVPLHLSLFVLFLSASHWWKQSFMNRAQAWGIPGASMFHAHRPEDGGPPPHPQGEPPNRPPGFPGGSRPAPPPGDRPPFDYSPPHSPGPPRGFAQDHGPRPPRFDLLHLVSFDLPIYLMLLTGAHALLFFRRDQERAASLARARLDALRMQLRPHFLFNTLNTIAGLVHDDPNKADSMLTSLSELLRISLDSSKQEYWPLRQEFDFLRRYLALMHARFEQRLLYTLDESPETDSALVPPMLLQPLVENAVEHGLIPKPGGGSVVVSARREGATLHLTVADDGIGLQKTGGIAEGLGLGNTKARLRELYGEAARLEVRSTAGTVVDVLLPFQRDLP